MSLENQVRCTLSNAIRKLRFCRYCLTKSAAQAMLDVALIVVNASHLTSAVRKGPDRQPLYYATVSLISVSISLEVLVALMIAVLERYDVDEPGQHGTLELLNNVLVWTVFISSVLHVFVAVFVDDHHSHNGPTTASLLSKDNCSSSLQSAGNHG